MEKLELKHLAPYLPYGLKCEIITTTDNVLIEKLTGFDCRFAEYALFGNVKNGTNGVGLFGDCKLLLTSVKPILRPIQEVELFFEDKWALGNDEDVKKYLDADFLWQNGNIEVNEIQLMEAEYLPYGTLQVLLKYNFDVFDLIEKGLAIDINTL